MLLALIIIPLLGFFMSLLLPEKQETGISGTAILTVSAQFIALAGFCVVWVSHGFKAVNINETVIYESKNYKFYIDFLFDKITMVYLLMGYLVTLLILRFSHYYLHLERGYKRFFNTVLFFNLAYSWTVLSGNFETMFAGWEMMGISSFLLIAFYRERYLPVRNAIKVFSIYRIGDIGFILAMWASHHLWHENITFLKLSNAQLVHQHLAAGEGVGLFIGVCLFVAAAAKSAQVPFSSWLPRAMEGPTPSSAIFYGSLSVHLGVFLLLRTYPFWQEQSAIRILIGSMGLVTALVSQFMSRVQFTIKTKIAYASIVHIGIIFAEVALGWHTLALIHFAGNAFFRTYQLLVSPSSVSHLIRDQFYHYQPHHNPETHTIKTRISNSLYMLSVKEWFLDSFMNRWVFKPYQLAGRSLDFLSTRNVLLIFTPIYLVGLACYFYSDILPHELNEGLILLCSATAMLMVMKAFSEREHPRLALILVLLHHFWVALAVSFNEHYDYHQNIIYLGGVSISGLIAFMTIQRLKKQEPLFYGLDQYYGNVREHPKLAFIAFLAVLGLMGFPITPSFIGEDLLFSHVHEHQYILIIFNSLSYVLGGIALMRIYARLFLGPHAKRIGATAIKSA